MTTDTRIQVSLAHLRSLQAAASGLSFLPRQPSASLLNGRHASRLRGRGLNFEEMRDYLPGDDIRSIDWKATARTGKPYVRVFTEERDRPALLVVDQRMSMFFGSQLNMKAVTAAEAAAITAFRVLNASDRVGGIVFNDDSQVDIAPRRSERTVFALLESIVQMNSALNADKTVVDRAQALQRGPLQLAQVRAGRKGRWRAGEDDRSDVRCSLQALAFGGDGTRHCQRHGVPALCVVQRHQGHAISHLGLQHENAILTVPAG